MYMVSEQICAAYGSFEERGMKILSCVVLVMIGLIAYPVGIPADEIPGETVVKVDKGDVVWSGGEADSQQIYFSTYRSGKGAWSDPVQITDDTLRNGHPVVDAGKDGKRVLVWTTATGNDFVIRYALGENGTWSEPAAIPSQLQENLAPSVIIDREGVIWVVWSANVGGQDEIYYACYAEEKWSLPMRVNGGNDVPDILPVIALNDQGIPQVTWKGYRDDGYVQLQSTWTGETWSEEVAIQDQTATGETDTETAETTETNAAIANMPSFIDNPEQAYLRVYKSSIVK